MHEHQNERGNGCHLCDVEESEESHSIRGDGRIVLIVSSAILLILGLVFEFILKWGLLAEVLFLTTAVISGYNIAREGFASLIFRRRLSIDFLMVIASIGSFLIGTPIFTGISTFGLPCFN